MFNSFSLKRLVSSSPSPLLDHKEAKMGKTFVVFGAGRGLSYQIGRKFAQEGYDIAFVARIQEHLDALVERLKIDAPNSKGKAFTADLSEQSQVTRVISEIEKEFATVDGLYCCPFPTDFNFIPATTLTVDIATKFWNQIFLSTLAVTQHFLPAMLERKEGTVLMATGSTAVMPKGYMSGPGPVQSAIRNFMLSLDEEVRPKGVHVGILTIHALILGTDIGDRLDKVIPPADQGGFDRVKAEDLGNAAWDMKQSNEVERFWGTKK